mmetsp:Transcript_27953/g.65742  ORF Transcript_27953/g.65742 Transcript_27953/m.65742 type:complete len:95 (-) Transcript_27953:2292-2576(-)
MHLDHIRSLSIYLPVYERKSYSHHFSSIDDICSLPKIVNGESYYNGNGASSLASLSSDIGKVASQMSKNSEVDSRSDSVSFGGLPKAGNGGSSE